MSGDIFLNIDTIVLRGLGTIDRHALTEAVQQALMEQLASNQTLTAADLSRVRTNITLPTDCSAKQLGQVLGQRLNGIISNSEAAKPLGQKTKQGGPLDV